MTLTNSSTTPSQRIEIAFVDSVGWFVVRQDDINQLRTYSKTAYNNLISVVIAALHYSQRIGWKLHVKVAS